MKVLNFIIGWITIFHPIYAQSQSNFVSKSTIDTSTLNHWTTFDPVKVPLISPDANYIAYWTTTNHYKRSKAVNKLILKATTGGWQQEYLISGSSSANFTIDNHFVFQNGDSLFIIKLGEDNRRVIPAVTSFQYKQAVAASWLAWHTKDQLLTVHNLNTGEDHLEQHVRKFAFNTSGTVLIIHRTESVGANKQEQVIWNDLSNFSQRIIWQSVLATPVSWTFDTSGQRLVFQTAEVTADKNTPANSIWYYQENSASAVLKVNNESPGTDSGMVIQSNSPYFNKEGSAIIFLLMKGVPKREPLPGAASVDVWSYTDKVFQTAQARAYPATYLAALEVDKGRVIRLQEEDEKIVQPVRGPVNDYLIVRQDTVGDRFWLSKNASLFKNYLVSVKDGRRVALPSGGQDAIEFWLSPDNQFVLYYLQSKRHYYSYNIKTGKTASISGDLPAGALSLMDEFERPARSFGSAVGIAGWIKGSNAVVVYDNYDLWQLDLQAQRPAMNLTNGMGKRTHTKLRLFNNQAEVLTATQTLYLTAYNAVTKQNGFYSMQLGKQGDPQKCTMGPYTYDLSGKGILPQIINLFSYGMAPVKATNVARWLVSRQSATEAPNYFLTTDFKEFAQLTNYLPSANVNWLTASLVPFPQLDGTTSQGVLYKPENFDSTKKYPLIITYYRQCSHRLYNFPPADYTENNINIPWFVSRGYLVFTPDIYFKKGTANGPHALNSIEGAARYLSTFKYVDGKKMGIMGHSVAGALTHYIITHSTRFAAALASAGVSNSISAALQINPQSGKSRLAGAETYSLDGKNMWEHPDLYLSTVCVLRAHTITTPLLMLHCLNDGAVPWQQSVEMFTSLWRLKKPVWLLQYDQGTHGVGGIDAVDYTLRVTQFFDHYLKDAPAPAWMQHGIDNKDKRYVQGY
jgi:dipeptidyl aminopeptidase/acylaminoacyl peptidase